jgi:hypothetical protein
MFSIATLLDSAKAKAGIESDYRLSKLIEINSSAVTNYRSGRSLPNEAILQRLCVLSGDDPELIAAQIQSRRAASEEARQLWQRVAERLAHAPRAIAGHARPIILLVLFAISFVAAHAAPIRASAGNGLNIANLISYTSYQFPVLGKLIQWCRIVAGFFSGSLSCSRRATCPI